MDDTTVIFFETQPDNINKLLRASLGKLTKFTVPVASGWFTFSGAFIGFEDSGDTVVFSISTDNVMKFCTRDVANAIVGVSINRSLAITFTITDGKNREMEGEL
jgi:hypothetical protein